MQSWLKKAYDFSKSLKLAVIIIVALAVISAVGTIYEARYDAEYAQKMVYQSYYMYGIMILLCITLISVMVDRWPWKKRHSAFVLAHIGIILTLIGSVFTQRLGIDGSLAFEIGETNRYVSVKERELSVWASMTGDGLTNLARRDTDFLLRPPQEEPVKINLGNKHLEVINYYHYAHRSTEIRPSEKEYDGPGVRFQLQNENVNFSEWILKKPRKPSEVMDLGPARIMLTSEPFKYRTGNVIVLRPKEDSKSLRYEIYTASHGGLSKSGEIAEGESLDTGWMGMTFRVLRYLPKAYEAVEFEKRDYPSKFTNSAIQLRFDGEEYWMGLNSVLRLFSDNQMYMISWGNKRIDLGFDMTLESFHIGHYQGTQRAASYESNVKVPGKGIVNISMNEPLDHNGFTFYQASFEQDETGKPVASILSVNRDPGRPLKYLGSFMIVLGSIMLFYFKKWGRASKPVQKAS